MKKKDARCEGTSQLNSRNETCVGTTPLKSRLNKTCVGTTQLETRNERCVGTTPLKSRNEKCTMARAFGAAKKGPYAYLVCDDEDILFTLELQDNGLEALNNVQV